MASQTNKLMSLVDDRTRLAGFKKMDLLLFSLREEPIPQLEPVETAPNSTVFFADDSAVARRKIPQVIEKRGVPSQQAQNGREARDKLAQLARSAEQEGAALAERLGMVLVDAE